MRHGVVLLAVAILALVGVANASVQQGDTELDFLAGFESNNGDGTNGNSDDLFAEIGLGYFLTDNIQAGVSASIDWTDEDSSGGGNGYESMGYGLGVFGKYHFMPTNQWVPYVGARVGYSWDETDYDAAGADDSTWDGVWYGPVAGVRFELNENNDFYAEYRYTLYGGDYNEVNDETHAVLVGIIHQFK
jgi:outer membrane protein W